MPILILEGSNKSGKTTLVNAIENYCIENKVEYTIMNKRVMKNAETAFNPDTPEQMYKVAIDDLSVAMKESTAGKLVIFDRFHVSEYVYGNIYRGYTNNHMLDVENVLAALKAKVFFVKSAYDHIDNAFEAWKLKKIQSDFEKYFGYTSTIPVRVVALDDVEEETVNEVANYIIRKALEK